MGKFGVIMLFYNFVVTYSIVLQSIKPIYQLWLSGETKFFLLFTSALLINTEAAELKFFITDFLPVTVMCGFN